MNSRSLGSLGESLAEEFIADLGWDIIGRNCHYRFGEVDILADDGSTVIIIEVKAKTSSQFGEAVEMITAGKKRVLIRLAKLIQSQYNRPVRIDVIAINNFGTPTVQVAHYPGAIDTV